MMMRNGKKVLVIGLVLLAGFASSASAVTKGMKKVVEDALDFSVRQSMSMFGEMKDQKGILPRTAKDGEMITCDSGWWTSGFYPGTLWYCYEYSNDPQVGSRRRNDFACRKAEVYDQQSRCWLYHQLQFRQWLPPYP